MHQRTFVFGRSWDLREPSRGERLVAFVIRWLITAAAVWVAAAIVGGIELEGWRSTLLVALILGLLNAVLKPLLFWVSLPITVLTLGVFYLVLNAAMLGLTAWIAGKFESIHFAVDGFWSAFWGAVIISIVSWFIGLVVNPKRIARDLAR